MTGTTRRRRGPTRRILLGGVAALVLIGGVGVGVVGGRARDAGEHLVRAGALLRQLHRQLGAGDSRAAAVTLDRLQVETAAAVDRTRGTAWAIGRRVVAVGDDLTALGTVADVLDDLARNGLPPLVAVAAGVDPAALVPRAGRIPLGPLADAAPALTTAATAVREALRRADGIPTAGLHARVGAGVTELRAGLRRAAALTGTAARTAALLPPMLGADGRRTYLVVVQNLAEVRATGGMPGAFVVVSADRGVVRMVAQGTAATDLRSFARPVSRVPSAMRALYTDRLTTYPADVNFTPHFPTAAALLREMYRKRSGHTVDGVLTADPVVLAHLLRATGPVNDPDGRRLTAGNAVSRLLSEVYLRKRDNATEDRYFAGVARAVFDRLTRAPGVPDALLTALARAAGERRLLVWSAHPAEQARIAGTVLEGALPTRDDHRPTVGVFLNDGSGAKLGYYLTRGVEVRTGACRPDGRRDLRVRVTLGSRVPRTGLPRSVLGLGLAGDPYTIRTNVLVFGPPGGTVADARLDNVPVGVATGAERGRAVGVVTVEVPPGGSRTLELALLTAAGGDRAGGGGATPRLWLTPGIEPWTRRVDSPATCGVGR